VTINASQNTLPHLLVLGIAVNTKYIAAPTKKANALFASKFFVRCCSKAITIHAKKNNRPCTLMNLEKRQAVKNNMYKTIS
jgi:hypothetical protein